MTDKEIINLYWKRSENAIVETDKKYGSYCYSLSYNILSNKEDAEECLNDTYMKTWNTIPPTRPMHFMAFLGKVIRNISLNLLKKNNAKKRGSDIIKTVSDELEDCIPDSSNVEDQIDYRILIECINTFLSKQPSNKANIFVRRYWYMDTIPSISQRFGMNENTVSSILFRMRQELKSSLEKEGINI